MADPTQRLPDPVGPAEIEALRTARTGIYTLTALLLFLPSTWAAEPFLESAGQVVIEAEHADANIPRSGKSWILESTIPGFSGTGYLSALPNTGVVHDTGSFPTRSPELQGQVNFSTAGTYVVWVRGSANGSSDDSIHAGLDGGASASADRISGFQTSWTWRRWTLDGAPATLNVATPGLHTVHLWMREDGLRVDKILLRKNSSSTAPSGVGPPESPRGGSPRDTTPPTISGVGASNITATAATITWMTNEPATSQVEYGPTTSYGQSTSLDSTRVTSHTVTLSNLTAATVIHYRVKSSDAAGNAAVSGDLTFTTSPPPTEAQEIVVDNRASNTAKSSTSHWAGSGAPNPYAGESLYSTSTSARFTWQPALPASGTYQVYAWWTVWKNRSTRVPYRITHASGTATAFVDQNSTSNAASGNRWNLLGSYTFNAGTATVEVSGENGQACADAIRFLRAGSPPVTDTTPPTLNGVNLAPGPSLYMGETLTISASVTDTDPSPLEYQFLWDGIAVQPWSSAGSFSRPMASTDFGRHRVTVQVRDAGGHVQQEKAIMVVHRPLEPPGG